MRLLDLDPVFLRYVEKEANWDVRRPNGFIERVYGLRASFVEVKRIEEAQGLRFLCPKCFAQNKGKVGTHQVICWSRSRGVPNHARPGPGRWKMVGTNFHDLSLEADPPKTQRSIQLEGGCAWHGFITMGEVT